MDNLKTQKRNGELIKFQKRPKRGTHKTDICGQYSSCLTDQDEHCYCVWPKIFFLILIKKKTDMD